jgi:hypothetical protein
MGLSEEINELREEYRIRKAYFEKDGFLDASELADLDMVEAEIKKLEHAYMDQAAKAQKVEPKTSGPKVKYDYGHGEGDSKYKTSVTISSEEISIEQEEGSAGVGLKVTKDEVEISGKKELAAGVEATVSLSNKKLAAGVSKKWELKEKSKKVPFQAGPVPCYVKFGIGGELVLGADGEANFETGIGKLGVKAEGKLSGFVEMGLNGGIVELGGRLTIIPSLKASGYLCYDSTKDEVFPDLSGLVGNINAKGTITLSAVEEVVNALQAIGVEKETLTFTIMESGEYNLLKITSPGYDRNGLKGDWDVSEGSDITTIKNKIRDAYNFIVEKYESIKDSAGAEFFDIENVTIGTVVDKSSYAVGQTISVKVNLSADNDDLINNDQHVAVFIVELRHKNSGSTVHASYQSEKIYLPEEDKIYYRKDCSLQIPGTIDKSLTADGWFVNATVKLNQNSKQVFSGHSGNFTIQ